MSKRAVRYTIYLAILAVAGLVIQRNAWQLPFWRYQIDARLIRHVTADPPGWEYYLHVPTGYKGDHEWPVLIYIHGTGGNGRDALHIWRPLANEERFFYLAPTFPTTGYTHLENGEDEALWAMISETERKYAIDRDRVFVCGFSGGAQFAHRIAFKYPRRVCGVSVMSAGSYDPPPSRGRYVPFALSVGEADAERSELARRFDRELRRKGYTVWYRTFPDVGHWMCGEAVDLTMRLFRNVAKTGG